MFRRRSNTVLFSVMGIAILLQTLVSVAVAVALWRKRFTDPALGWALRLGMTLTIVGALSGPLMTRPTAAQLADCARGGRMTTAGAHTVGGVDGGPGVPVTGWSRDHGDLRDSALHRPARDPGAGAHRDRPAAVAPA